MSIGKYDYAALEPKWQAAWDQKGDKPSKGKKKYILEMFPYPSGKIHMGHVRNYSIGDLIARYSLMRGYDVLHPMGWDSFGLPAENAAIERGIHPGEWTLKNIDFMRGQMKKLGFLYDWDREVATCLPDYYKWNQWLFKKFYEKGLVYRKRAEVNFCGKCQTVLANEQAEGGVCWRCGSEVELKKLEQWFFKITDYADRLLEDYKYMNNWPERVITMQKNWIGKSFGVEIFFKLDKSGETLPVFTTRQDTIFGCSYVVLALDHPLVKKLIEEGKDKGLDDFVRARKAAKAASGREDDLLAKEGYFTGLNAVNPVNNEKVPVWTSDYVLMEYGTGAIMAVPSHDQRDFEFAKKYSLPITVVINPENESLSADTLTAAYEGSGLQVNSGRFNGLPNERAKDEIALWMEKEKTGKRTVNYRLKDWLISRQRYWGTPIPAIYCDKCGIVFEKDENLPVLLPKDIEFRNVTGNPLAGAASFVNTTCPSCGSPARRETDTMDTFVDSSWYFLRYCSPHSKDLPFDKKDADYWMPVDQYIGGIEHACLHLLYARFFTKVLSDLGLCSVKEPFLNLLTQGMVIKDGFKMSKSKGNVVDPEEMISKYGADAVRLFILFASPPEKDLDWAETGIEGASRFINRLWKMTAAFAEAGLSAGTKYSAASLDKPSMELCIKINRVIEKVTKEYDSDFHFNTAISNIMELYNMMSEALDGGTAPRELIMHGIEAMVKLLAPICPHACEELWLMLGKKDSAFASWPSFDGTVFSAEKVTIIIQVNGKLRDRFEAQKGLGRDEVKKIADSRGKLTAWVGDKPAKQLIFVQDKLLNIVI